MLAMIKVSYKAYLITYGCIWFEFKNVVRWISSTFIFINIFSHPITFEITVVWIHRLVEERRINVLNANAIFRLKIKILNMYPFLQTQIDKYQRIYSY